MTPRISGPISARPLERGKESSSQLFRKDKMLDMATLLLSKLPHPEILDASQPITLPTRPPHHRPISILCLSDTHNATPSLPLDGKPVDILLHAGDLTDKGTFTELQAQLNWLSSIPKGLATHKVVIGGNHDLLLDDAFVRSHPEKFAGVEGEQKDDLQWGNTAYLQDESIVLTLHENSKLSIFGCPSTPAYGTFAFQYPPIRQVWRNKLPAGTDILLTHGPPKGRLDSPFARPGKMAQSLGCPQLLREIWRVQPRLIICGHIHESRGVEVIDYGSWKEWAGDMILGMQDRSWKAWCAIAVLVVLVIWDRLAALLRTKRFTTLSSSNTKALIVNAAMVAGPGNNQEKEAIRIEI